MPPVDNTIAPINDQWQIIFQRKENNAQRVSIIDYH